MGGQKKGVLAGDSISRGYGPIVAKMLADTCEVSILPENGGTSGNLLAHFEDWFVAPGFDVIHFNCGLHDIARDRNTGKTRTTIEDYQDNLLELTSRLKSRTDAKLAWATTTPVIYERHLAVKDFNRDENDVTAWNNVALGVVTDAGISVDDLHEVIESAGIEECICEDGVHMTEKGNAVLSDAVARFVTRMLSG